MKMHVVKREFNEKHEMPGSFSTLSIYCSRVRNQGYFFTILIEFKIPEFIYF